VCDEGWYGAGAQKSSVKLIVVVGLFNTRQNGRFSVPK